MSENGIINVLLGDHYCLLKLHITRDITAVMIILINRVTRDQGLTESKL